jgi:hypothetical protein
VQNAFPLHIIPSENAARGDEARAFMPTFAAPFQRGVKKWEQKGRKVRK